MTDAKATTARLGDGVVLAVLSFVVGVVLRQECAYGDATGILIRNHLGPAPGGYHMLYAPLLDLFRSVVEPMGFTFFEVAGLFSAFGTALGVLLVHIAFGSLLKDRWRTVVATAMFATLPSVVFFSTVVEFHGPFVTFLGLCAIATTHLVLRPTWWAAMLLGVATSLAFYAHATGYVTPGMFFALACAGIASRDDAPRWPHLVGTVVVLGICVGLTHALLVDGLRALLAEIGLLQSAAGTEDWLRVQASLMPGDVGTLARCLVDEVLVPYLPLSLLVPVALGLRRARTLAAGILVGLVPYVVLIVVVLAGRFYERGAYVLPLGFGLAWLGAITLRRAHAVLVVVGGLAIGIGLVFAHADEDMPRRWAEGLRAVAPPDALVLIGDPEGDDIERCFVGAPDYEFWPLTDIAILPRPDVVPALEPLREFLEEQVAARDVFLTAGAEGLLHRTFGDGVNAAGTDLVLALIETHFDLEPITAGTFRAKRLVAKP